MNLNNEISRQIRSVWREGGGEGARADAIPAALPAPIHRDVTLWRHYDINSNLSFIFLQKLIHLICILRRSPRYIIGRLIALQWPKLLNLHITAHLHKTKHPARFSNSLRRQK